MGLFVGFSFCVVELHLDQTLPEPVLLGGRAGVDPGTGLQLGVDSQHALLHCGDIRRVSI